MRKIKKMTALLIVCTLLVMAFAVPASAESMNVKGKSSFNGKDIISDFDNKEIADAVTNLQPGDDITFTVTYTNDYEVPTDWYMETEILKTLEAVGSAENGGYTFILTHTDSKGNSQTLFSNENVGGDKGTIKVIGPDGKEYEKKGLEPATNALEDWFFLQTLAKDESGTVTLQVVFDGETEVNDYMDTDGKLAIRFATELEKQSVNKSISKHINKTVKTSAPQTGDPTDLFLPLIVMAAGIILLLVAAKKRRDSREENGIGGGAV